MVETLYRSAEQRTLFCVSQGDAIRYETELAHGSEKLVPYSPHNPLLANNVVLLPAELFAVPSRRDAVIDGLKASYSRPAGNGVSRTPRPDTK